MDLLEFDDLSLFSKISLDEETLMIYSKCGKYSFYINFKDEIKGVDYYELAIATETSSGFINKSGTANIIKKAVMDTLTGKNIEDSEANNGKKIVSAKYKSNSKSNPNNKTSKFNMSNKQNRGSIYSKKRGPK